MLVQQPVSSRWLWLLFLGAVVLLFSSLGKMPLWIYDEVRNAECAREMWERKDWIVPTFNGELRNLKPPLHYYFMAGGFQLFGLNEWGARFFSAVFGVLTILLNYYFVARYSSRRHAFISCCVLLVSTHFLFQMRMSVPDPYLIFLNAASLFTGYAYFKEKRFQWLLLCAVSLGLGTLAKGPVAIALPSLSLLVWLIWQKQWKLLFHWHMAVAAVLTLVIAVPWYVAVHNATDGAWTRGFFLEHNLGRFSEPMEGHGGLFIIVPRFVLLGLLPASIFIGESLRHFKQRFSDPFLCLAFCVMAVYIIFYSISGTKLPNYPTPCYPFVAIVLGYYINMGFSKSLPLRRYPFYILLVINLALPIGLYFGIKNEVELHGFEAHALLMLILTAAAVVSLLLFLKRGFQQAMLSLLFFYTVFNLVFFNYLYPTLYQNNPLSKTINIVRKYDNVVAYKIFQPAFTFYVPHRIPVFDQPDSLNAYLQNHEALVILREAAVPELQSLGLQQLAAHHDLFERHTTVLLTNAKK
ncbi:MAG TPA: glycosyltransferase family 39 protein [Chitinophagaceae bacterium]|nr:glycosyltransferase family 39 protein [Chitinophagaceae bacterium]